MACWHGCLVVTFLSALVCLRASSPHGNPIVLAQIAARPSKCPGQCTLYGTCNEELGRCDCPKTRDGPDCSVLLDGEQMRTRCMELNYHVPNGSFGCPDMSPFSRFNASLCLNNCNGRGKCEGGFCHCLPGHYGTDCAKSLDQEGRPTLLQGTGYTTRAKRPWIYVYDLPPVLNAWPYIGNLDRPQYLLFWHRLLGSGAQIAEPDKADWFFVPLVCSGALLDFCPVTLLRLTFLRGDTGRIGAGLRSLGGYENMTFLQHWGIYKDRPTGRKWKQAHRPGKDIVIPSVQSFMLSPHATKSFGASRFLMHGFDDRFNDTEKRLMTFFFAGRICGERKPPTEAPWPDNCQDATGYSGGIRQRTYYEHHNRTGYTVTTHTPNYVRYLKASKFCLSPLGGACGDRQIVVTVAGCIPVVIGDDVHNYFEPEMDWRPFSVMLKESQIPEIHTVIESISVEQRKKMQTAMKCAAHHLMHGTSVGGILDESGRYDAFETTSEILRMRADYPGTPPEEYVKVDQFYKRFMACGADEIGQDPPPDPKPDFLCHHNRADHIKCNGNACFKWTSPVLGPPGGAICCGHQDLSTCPRLWD
ncbi:exostosin-like glycosyltransferase [Dunaliella salina]|uniref:Exostosin-like glycosyltransferase n=1 Tax=Dunaliella salina TaxID=3046 RepID=A0ABQ7G0L2_DUNSA|nr:exostosin-like glycosyltransferase [Dunaliella salina]|eukprot:KAF5828139.1 exostosin-like glycosyltransferase [Dunaliella salina]